MALSSTRNEANTFRWAIVGITDQYVNQKIDITGYKHGLKIGFTPSVIFVAAKYVSKLMPHILGEDDITDQEMISIRDKDGNVESVKGAQQLKHITLQEEYYLLW